ncbi:MAG: hypothetical protein GC181_12235 [Bacteroidetes bacterium]|nr:hypothetical protein [Bacteroidota bacterium]
MTAQSLEEVKHKTFIGHWKPDSGSFVLNRLLLTPPYLKVPKEYANRLQDSVVELIVDSSIIGFVCVHNLKRDTIEIPYNFEKGYSDYYRIMPRYIKKP